MDGKLRQKLWRLLLVLGYWAKSWIGTKAAAKKGALRHWLLPFLPLAKPLLS